MDTYYRAKELYAEGNLPESHKLLTNFIVSQRGISGNAAAQLTDAFNTRGHIHYRWVDFDEAIQDYSEAIKVDPTFAVAYYNRGQVHYRLGKKFGELCTVYCDLDAKQTMCARVWLHHIGEASYCHGWGGKDNAHLGIAAYCMVII